MNCCVCGNELLKYAGRGRPFVYCSDKCKRVGQIRATNKWISNNWERYFDTLCRLKNRKEQGLNSKILIEILERQNYKCALTGLELTCLRDPNKRYGTNASIDRIDSNLGYNIDNIHLVCADINIFKRDMTVDEFVDWCKRVVVYALCK